MRQEVTEMVAMAITITGIAAFLWQIRRSNRALMLRSAADAAGWLQDRLSRIAQNCRPSGENAPRDAVAGGEGGDSRPDYASRVVTTIASTEAMRSSFSLYL